MKIFMLLLIMFNFSSCNFSGIYDNYFSSIANEICSEIKLENCPAVYTLQFSELGIFKSNMKKIEFRDDQDLTLAYYLYGLNNIYVHPDTMNYFSAQDQEYGFCFVIAHEVGHAYHRQILKIKDTVQMERIHGFSIEDFSNIFAVELCEKTRSHKRLTRQYFHRFIGDLSVIKEHRHTVIELMKRG